MHGTLTRARRYAALCLRIHRRLLAVERRLDEIEADLDFECEGSVAEWLGDLYDDHQDLRARVDEWTGVRPAHAEDQPR